MEDSKVNIQNLYQDVKWLCELRPYRNYQQRGILDLVARTIKERFEKLGLEPSFQSYLAQENEYHNVLASYQSDKSARIVLGAHYDVDGDQPGADDNASAVAGLLEIARLVAEAKPQLDYRLDFVAYTLEEAPFFYTDLMGSAVHAQSLRDQNIPLELMICLEMIGYFSDKENSQKFPLPQLAQLYPNQGNFIALVGRDVEEEAVEKMKTLMRNHSEIGVESFCAPLELVKDITRSDHFNYWQAGYPALMITDTSFLRNPNYHQASDTLDTLDFKRMGEVLKGLFAALCQWKVE